LIVLTIDFSKMAENASNRHLPSKQTAIQPALQSKRTQVQHRTCPPESVRRSEGSTDDRRKRAIKGCLKKALKFTFSQFGLCAVVTLYAVAGGFIFQHLEKTNEKQECLEAMLKYYPMENATVYRLWDVASSFQEKDDAVFALDAFQKQLQSYRDDVLALGYDGSNCSAMGEPGGPQYQWSYSGSLLFSVTVFTTIGYGNIAPKTFWGRLVCIAYAVLGIPLMLLCLANLGEVMANIFRFVYARICCCGFFRLREATPSSSEFHLDPTDEPTTDQTTSLETWKAGYEAQRKKTATLWVPEVMDPEPHDPVFEDIEDDDDDDDDDDLKITVPLTVTMAVIAGYLFMGSLLFGVWEGWDWLKAAYYCFITIATIGFGDVVPGSATFDGGRDQWKMIGATVYIVFGMAIMSMAFNLIQEEIVSKFTWIAEKLGILEKQKDGEAEPAEHQPRLGHDLDQLKDPMVLQLANRQQGGLRLTHPTTAFQLSHQFPGYEGPSIKYNNEDPSIKNGNRKSLPPIDTVDNGPRMQ